MGPNATAKVVDAKLQETYEFLTELQENGLTEMPSSTSYTRIKARRLCTVCLTVGRRDMVNSIQQSLEIAEVDFKQRYAAQHFPILATGWMPGILCRHELEKLQQLKAANSYRRGQQGFHEQEATKEVVCELLEQFCLSIVTYVDKLYHATRSSQSLTESDLGSIAQLWNCILFIERSLGQTFPGSTKSQIGFLVRR